LMVNFLSDTRLEGEPRGETFSTGEIAAEKHQRSILPICEMEGNKTIKVQSVFAFAPRRYLSQGADSAFRKQKG